MSRRMGGWADGRMACALLAAVSAYPPIRLSAQGGVEERGKAVYDKWCAQCHGETGAGDGPAASYMLPRPRDFTAALYQVRTTASGQLPTDGDLTYVIDEGVLGTAMPGWRSRLSAADRRAVLASIKSFSAFFADTTQRPQPLEFGRAPGGGGSAEALAVGRQFYDSIGCYKCHGQAGRGDGPSAPTLDDDMGMPTLPADLTESWRFNGGTRVADIYRRLRTGMDGTPMPSFSDLIDQQFLTDEQLWRLAQYVRSLSPEAAPGVREVVHARQIDGALPTAPDDSAWATIEPSWFPLAGQIIRRPRWFSPAVSGVWAQAVHNGEAVALRVTWHDRSQSPDTAWLEYTGKVLRHLAGDDSVPAEPELWPDQLVVQYPRRIPQGMERPYFLMGSVTEPVYQWRWVSSLSDRGRAGRVVAGVARGIERFDPLPAATVGADARYEDGAWRVVFSRALATADTSNELQFQAGRAIPVAFFAWDGSSGERGSRMALSAWYFLALDRPTSPGVLVSPVLAALLSFGLGLLLVRRAQRGRGAP